MATSFNVNKADLEFILRQIKISEATSIGYTPAVAPVSIQQAIMTEYGLSAADSAIAPFGLRTVDGSFNSLVAGQNKFGAADTVFPRLTDPVYRDVWNDANGDNIRDPSEVQSYSANGTIVDSAPRIISNLIVDMSVNNPAAIAAYLGNPLSLEQFEADHPGRNPVAPGDVVDPLVDLEITNTDLQTIPNQSPDIGLSPGFNSWMTFFGQFFDHGLDLVTKGGNGSVIVPLQADDPLIAGADGQLGTLDDLPAHLRFMALSRATPVGGGQENTTTSFVDQNQTYTSHASHQVFLREYKMTANGAVSTGKMLDGGIAGGSVNGAIGNWAEVKAQALTMLGIQLTDFDVHNVPFLLTDQYGKFIPVASGPNAGYAQMIVSAGADGILNTLDDVVKEGTASGATADSTVLRTGHAFLNDIAHHAAPGMYDSNGDHVPDAAQVADADPGVGDDGLANTYDDEMLNAHFVTGDGRGNENIALTAVHSIFHSEHNRLVDVNKATIIASGDVAFLNEWLLVDQATNLTAAQVQALNPDTLTWDGERLFQAARFGTEMQYQHMVFEEFARRIQPMVDPFIFNTSPDVDPSIVAEFAHTVYRYGHSMLTGTVDRLDNNLNLLNGDMDQKTLLAVFLNPQAYIGSGADLEAINANIIRGLSRDVGNAIDEFIVTDVRSNLLGLPLDLAVLNLSRGRETGIPSLNQTREQLYNDTGLADLKPYESWADFALNIKNAASVVNFIAAYGTHSSITGATTLADKRAAAEEIVFGVEADGTTPSDITDRLAFLNGSDAYAGSSAAGAAGTHGGLNLIDLWIGGLAEKSPEFGGMLGTTFNYVFEFQMEQLQFGDRMYYLTRTQGLNFLNNLEPNTFSDIVMRNTELGDIYSTHLNGALFTTPDHIIELDRGIAQTDYNGAAAGNDPLWDGSNPVTEAILGPKVVRDYTGASTVGVPTSFPIANGSFEQNSLATGQPGVIADLRGNYTMTAPTGWTISGGQGGMFAPANTVTDPSGHAGSNVVWLSSGAMLSKNTGVTLVQGATYTVNLKVGDRTDLSWPGGTVRLMASDGINPAVTLATLSLPTPAEGQWSDVMVTTPSIASMYNGYTLYVEVQQGDGTGNQILVDDVSIAAVVPHDVGGYLRVLGGEHYVLGGTEGDDRIYGDSGIDTLWGDGGNDYLNGGTESDDVFGGEGDDIIEDPFGDDVLRGNQGNDVITAARGADLLFGDQGQDYIVLGQDASEVFGGTGTDFILGGMGKDFLLGNEGDDWMEGGGGFDTLAGENSELFFNSPIIGHDVLFGQGDETDYDAESGDDIMVSGPSVYRNEGMFGFDWAIAKNDNSNIHFNLFIPIFTTIPEDVLRDRFDQVEALSGWKNSDILDGDDRGHKGGGSSAPDSVPVELFADHLLTQEGIDRIDGFNDWFGGARNTLFGAATPIPGTTSLPATTYRDGNILMGGDGSDFLRGRGGYDILDGDAWLNVRIKIVHNGVTYSAESMSSDTVVAGPHAGKVFNTDANGDPIFTSPAFGGASLTSLLLNRTLNPGELSIVREILYDTTPNDNDDTAIFQGTLAEYEIEGRVSGSFNDGTSNVTSNSALWRAAFDVNNDGFISVRDKDTGAVGATIVGPDGQPLQLTSSRGALTDDTDLLKNVELLRFADKTVVIGGNNQLATGTVTIADLQNKLVNPADVSTTYDLDGNPATPALVTPYVGQVLKASLAAGFADADGIPLGPDGLPVGLTFEWQTTETGGNAGWSKVGEGASYTVRSVDPGHILRAVAVFKDSDGATETIISAPTDGATPAFRVNENSGTNTVVATSIPFNPDYDPDQTPGGPTDGDIVALTHVMRDSAGGRFKLATVGGVQQIQVANGGSSNLNYEVDNEYQIVIDSYIDAASAAALDPAGRIASRQFTVLLNNVEPEAVVTPPTDIQWNGVTPGDGTPLLGNLANGLPGAGSVIANLSTTDADTTTGFVYALAAGSSANFAVSAAGVVTRTGSAMASNTTYTLNISSTDTTGATRTEMFTIKTGTNSVAFGTNGANTIAADVTDSVIYASGGNDTLNGAGGNDNLFGQAGDDTLNGNGGNDNVAGGGGNDAINGGAGNDRINGGAQNDTITQLSTDGRDIVDGGANTDTYVLNGVAAPETFRIYTRAAFLGINPTASLQPLTEIVITRDGIDAASVIAELDNIEEISVNTLNTTANNGNNPTLPDGGVSGGDTIIVIGNFNAPNTSLNFNTITIDGNAGDDTIDISALTSAHRIVFKSNGGNDTIIGNLRPQDVINLPAGATAANYTTTTDANGLSTMTDGTHTIKFTATGGMPQVGHDDDEDDDDDDAAGNDHDNDDDDNDDDDCGSDGDGDTDTTGGTGTTAPITGVVRTGTPMADVLAGTTGDDNIIALAGDDVATGDAGADAISVGEGADFVSGGDGRDVIFAGAGDDQVFGGGHADVIYGDAGADRIFGDAGNDLINAGAGDDAVFGGAGDDLIVAELGDGSDVYFGDDSDGGNGIDTLDISAATANVTVNLGSGALSNGTASSSQTGNDTIWGIENVNTGSGSDTITASNAANVMKGGAGNDTYRFASASAADGDTILGFEPGDRVDLTAIDANLGAAGDQSFTLVSGAAFTAAGQLSVTYETGADGDFTVVQGNTGGNNDADFTVEIAGHHNLTNANLGL